MKRDAGSFLFNDHELFLFVHPVDVALIETLLKVSGGLPTGRPVSRVVCDRDLNV